MNVKNLIKDFIPPIILKAKQKIFNKGKGYKPKYAHLVRDNIKFKNIHKGERVFILASGPSINTQDLKPLKNEYCIAVSHFHLHKDIQTIKPQYHVLAPQHPPFTFNDSSKYFLDFKKAYKNIEPHIFLGINDYEYSYLELLKAKPELVVPNLHYIDYSYSYQLDENNYLDENIWDITKVPFAMRTVVYGAIMLAYYMGFSEIYLLGVDHDYLNDVSRIENHHFYREKDGISDVNHLKEFSTERWFYEYYMRWKQYRLMKNFLDNNNVKIFNATNGGMLDVFPIVDFNKIVNNQ